LKNEEIEGMKRRLAVVIMAAGKGTRMKDPSKAKVMFEICGKPLVHYVLDLAFELRADRIVAVVGYQAESVSEYVRKTHPGAEIALQAQQLGTGHAVLQTETALKDFEGPVLVLSGDVPLLRAESIRQLINRHNDTQAEATILTAELDDPASYGRVVRNKDGSVKKIVEYKDASDRERAVKEINSGIYVFDKQKLFESLHRIKADNAQQEYYLTDVFEYFWDRRWRVSALKTESVEEIRGINTAGELAEARDILAHRSSLSHS
jgi:UDP-N-acetylglucosamine diphosphorylase/glucosamine-1-phosphate N-acetyltransferase